MQYTDKYHFNLIEESDTFSPTPLNENAKTAEAQLAALADANAGYKAELLTAMGSGGNTCRIAWGSLVGDGSRPVTLEFDFRPIVVFLDIDTIGKDNVAVLVRGTESPVGMGANAPVVRWGDNSVTYGDDSALPGNPFNTNGRPVYFAAIGESLDAETDAGADGSTDAAGDKSQNGGTDAGAGKSPDVEKDTE